MADGLQIVSSGSPSGTTWQKVARRVVIDCTSSTRPSSGVLVGMHIYETDTFLLRRWDGSRWVTYPMGLMDLHSLTATGPSSSTSQVPVNNSGCTFDAVAGQRYSYEFGCAVTQGNTPGQLSFQCQRDDGGGYTDADVQRDILCDNAFLQYHFQYRVLIGYGSDTPSAKIRMTVQSGGGTWGIIAGSDVSVTHIGDFV